MICSSGGVCAGVGCGPVSVCLLNYHYWSACSGGRGEERGKERERRGQGGGGEMEGVGEERGREGKEKGRGIEGGGGNEGEGGS